MFAFGQGQISPIIRADDGFIFFRFVEKRPDVPFDVVNTVMDKKVLRHWSTIVYRNLGAQGHGHPLGPAEGHRLRYSTRGGLSICIDDMIIPPKKWEILKKAEEQVTEIAGSTPKA